MAFVQIRRASGAAFLHLTKEKTRSGDCVFDAKGTADQLHRLQFEVDKCCGRVARDAEYTPLPPPAPQSPPPPPTFECSVCFQEFLVHDGVACVAFHDDGDKDRSHSFCPECIHGQATALSDPSHGTLATGGVGLVCMDADCGNVLLMSNLRLQRERPPFGHTIKPAHFETLTMNTSVVFFGIYEKALLRPGIFLLRCSPLLKCEPFWHFKAS